jgi:hypothetical protein
LKTLAILLASLTFACGTIPVVGKWRAVRTYDFHRQTWRDVSQTGSVELSSDGKFKVTLPGEKRTGEYELDESVNPHRFVATDGARRAVRGIYKVEGDKLTVRGTDGTADLEFLQSFDPSEDKTTFPMVELAREKE